MNILTRCLYHSRRLMRSLPFHVVVLTSVVGACESADPRPTPDGPEWHVQPTLAIGVEAGDPAFEFGRVTNAIQLSDGRIAVADGGNVVVRLFTPDGMHDRSFGRRGSGPGEFNALTRLSVMPGDTLIAGGTSRLARYTSGGAFVSQERFVWAELSRPPLFVEYAVPLADGTFLLMLIETSAGQPAERPLHRSSKLYLTATRDRGQIDSLGIFPALEQMSYTEGAETHTAIPLFPADTRMAVSPGHVVIGDLDADSVLLFELAGGRRFWVNLPLRKEPIPPQALAAAKARACTWASGDALERCHINLRQLPAQGSYPVFRDIAVDSLGIVWVSRFPDHATPDSSTWLAFGKSGQRVGAAVLPANLRLTQIGETYILGVARDSLGVERVRLFRLSRGP